MSLEVCNQTKVRNVPWKELQGEGHLDPRERLRRAYLRAQPAFYHFWPRFRSGGVCAGDSNPLTEAACGADADGFLVTQLYHAASPLPLLGYKNTLPTDGEMLVRLMALGLVATWDYTENNNQCFQNGAAVADRKDAATLCADLYAPANNNAAAFPDLTTGVSTSDGTTFTWPPAESNTDGQYILVPGCVDDYYATYTTWCVGEAGQVGSNTRPDVKSMRCEDNTVPPAPPGHLPPSPPSPPPLTTPLNVATAHVRHCERALEISEAGVELLFGLPHIERGAHLTPVGGALTQFATFIYDSTRGPWYDHQRIDNVRVARQREAALYTAYRLAVALFFAVASLCLLCYWLGRGATMAAFILVPWALDSIIGGIGSKRQRFRFDTFSRPPFSAVHIVVLVAAIVAYCFARFVDPLPAPGGLAPTCNVRGGVAGAWDTTTVKDTAVFHAANLLLLLAVISIVFEVFFARGSGDKKLDGAKVKRRAASELVQLALVGGIAVGIVFQTLAVVDVGHNWALKLQVADEANTNLGPLQLAAAELKGDVLVVTYLAASQSAAFGALMTRFAVKHLRSKFWIVLWLAVVGVTLFVGNLARNLHNQDLVTEALQPNQPYSHRQAAFYIGLITDIAIGGFAVVAALNEWRSMRRVYNTTLAAFRAQGYNNPAFQTTERRRRPTPRRARRPPQARARGRARADGARAVWRCRRPPPWALARPTGRGARRASPPASPPSTACVL